MRFYKTVVLDIVGLTRDLISKENTPFLYQWSNDSKGREASFATIEPAFPAITCVPQTTYLTGKLPSEHGIVGNGFYDREYCEIRNWHQSSKLVRSKRIFETLKEIAKAENSSEDETPTTFSNCWWFPMYDTNIDYVITPRPQYLQDGGKLADIYTQPPQLRDELQLKLGMFPLHRFWGQMTSIESSQWIANAAITVDKSYNPTLSLIYLPHLDYCLQKYGPNDGQIVPTHLKEIDQVVKSLIEYYEEKYPEVKIMILSEYGISPVNRVIHINRLLRNSGYIKIRRENGGETIDYGACDAFALSDHQVAHIYIRDKKHVKVIKELLKSQQGIEYVLEPEEQNNFHNENRLISDGDRTIGGAYFPERSGDLLAVAHENSWFSYYFWNDPSQAPDYARCVAIHKKPGYDPAEMFFRYQSPLLGKLYLFFKLFIVYFLRIRSTVDACPLEADMVRGSHGCIPKGDKYKPVLISKGMMNDKKNIKAEDVHNLILTAVTGKHE